MIDRLKLEVTNLRNKRPSSGFSLFKKPQNHKKKTTVRGNLSIFKKSNENSDFVTKDLIPLIKIEQNLKEFKIIDCRENCQIEENGFSEDLWLELSMSSNKFSTFPCFEVKPNDILRLGNAYLEILLINFESAQQSFNLNRNYTLYSSRTHSLSHRNQDDLSLSNPNIFTNTPTKSSFSQDQSLCRICYTEVSESDMNNLGITFCSCSGSLQYSHLSCMKKWLNKKIKYLFMNEEIMIFEENELRCEICLNEIPIRVLIKGTEFFLLDFEDKFRNYVVIRDVSNSLINVVNLTNKKELYIGNGADLGCDLIVQHESVESFHCKLTTVKGRLYAEDLDTRRKTFMKIREELLINPFVAEYKIRKGEWEFVFRPEREKITFFTMFCDVGRLCGSNKMNCEGIEKEGKEMILE